MRKLGKVATLALYLEQDMVGLLYYNEDAQHVWVKYSTVYYDDTWHSLAVTHDVSTYRLYLDGYEVASQADSFSDFGSMNALMGSYDTIERFLNDWYSDCVDMEADWKSRESVVISPQVASLTGVFTFKATTGSGDVLSGTMVMTAVPVKMDGKWIYVQGHELAVPEE